MSRRTPPLTNAYSVRLSPRYAQQLTALADDSGETISSTLRAAVRTGLQVLSSAASRGGDHDRAA